MAGISGLPSYIDYMGALNQQRYAQQDQDMRMQQFKQAQQDRATQQRAQAEYGQYLASLGGGQPQGQMAPPPQPPAPGQASQPAQQPGQMQQPQGVSQGQSAGMGLGGQLPPPPIQQAYQAGMQAGVQHVVSKLQQRQGQTQQPQGQLPPFRPMPDQAPQQQQAAPSSIGTPPQGQQQPQQGQPGGNGPISLQSALRWMDQKGIDLADRPAVLEQMKWVLDAQAQQQLAAAKEQDRQRAEAETQAYHHASLNQRADTSDNAGWQLMTDSSGKNYRYNARTNEMQPVSMPGGTDASGLTKTGGKPPGASGADGTDYSQPLKNSGQEAQAQAIQDGRAPPIANPRTPAQQAVMGRVYANNPDFDAKDYGTHTNGLKYWLGNGQGAKNLIAQNTSFSHLGTLQDMSASLKSGGLPAWNAVVNRITTANGQPEVTDFEAGKKIVGDEVVKAISGAGGGTESDRAEVAAILDPVKSPEQMAGAIGTLRKLIAGKMEAYERAYTAGTGRNDFRSLLSPEAASYLPQGGKGAGGNALPVGYVYQGYRFKGGDSGVKSNWEKM